MLGCLHKIEVKPGDAFMIYGGVPHAIGAGCFLMEVQEPTDYTMRVEKTTPSGLNIGSELIHQGVGEEKMLECFHYDTHTIDEALSKWKITPEVLDSSNDYTLKTLFNEKHTNCFGLRPPRTVPSNVTVPAVVGASCKMERPRVDFPEPDSPTKPRISPRCISRETPSTALIYFFSLAALL